MTNSNPLNEIYGSRVNSEVRVFGSPHRYVQGPGALGLLGAWALSLGGRAVVLVDPFVREALSDALDELENDDRFVFVPTSGEVTLENIDRLAAESSHHGEVEVAVGVGGGKALDLARAVSWKLGSRFITVPTIASNDSPAAMAVAVYDDAHRMIDVIQTARNPDVVLVDTALIAGAPTRFFSAGIGDALSKKFETRSCRGSGGRNQHGTLSLRTAEAIADACYDTLRDTAVPALDAVRRSEVTPQLEDAVEATVLMSGLGFENGGLSIAHSIVRGLQAVPETQPLMHGEHVAYGLLIQLALEAVPDAELIDLADFLRAVELPTSLVEMGASGDLDACAETITSSCLASPHSRKTPAEVNRETLHAAIQRVEALAANRDKE